VGLTTGLPPGGAVAEQGRACAHYLSRRFRDVLLEHRSAIAGPDPEVRIDVAFRVVFDSLERRVMYGPQFESSHVIDWPALLSEETAACSAYLLGPPPPPVAASPPEQHTSPTAPEAADAQRQRLLDAGVALLSETPALDPTIQAVARRAGVSVGTVYNSFPSKEALFVAIIDHAQSALDAEFDEVFHLPDWTIEDPDELVVAAVQTIAANGLTHQQFLSAIVPRALTDPRISERGSRTVRLLGRRFEAVLLTQRDAIAHADPEAAADVCFRLVFSAIVKYVAMGADFESAHPTSWERLVGELGDLARAYLLRGPTC
jgi:AcrR family transcriptional regulator